MDPWLAVLMKIKDLDFDLLTVAAQETKELGKEPPLNYRPFFTKPEDSLKFFGNPKPKVTLIVCEFLQQPKTRHSLILKIFTNLGTQT